MKFPELETERLKLVQVSKEHIKSFYEIMARDEVARYYGMESLKSIEDASQIVESFQNTFENRRGIRWGIVIKETEDFIGTLGLNNLSTWSKKAEIGFELHPSHWKKGFTSEAIKAVLKYSFDELELYRMGAITYPQNEPSILLLRKLGFTEEGLLRGYLYQNNQSHDALIFSLLQTEWK
ncbi:GNAT family N-acetyltransferase [Halobacillus amylolyticus]|uniref:GNAT family N-acetyltransferase n=1 Tax=Halobacillus amylolyticus TaxID=2932259 RepID=A0ABY4HE24_9BACI|nr:GNAT family protein [Halobacillus amylolyticus]UOR12672.1 GNAT family N-acetyltransferase [Halobacillus amylolyticus]